MLRLTLKKNNKHYLPHGFRLYNAEKGLFASQHANIHKVS